MNAIVHSLIASALPELLKIVFEAIGVVLAGYAALIAHRIAKKYGLDISERQDAQIQFVVKQAIQKAEEVVNARLPKDDPERAAMKRSEAIGDILEQFPQMSAGEALGKIHATLPELGLGASGPKLIPFEPAPEVK